MDNGQKPRTTEEMRDIRMDALKAFLGVKDVPTVSKETTQARAWEIKCSNAKAKGGANSRRGEALGTTKHAHEASRKENKAARFEKRNGVLLAKPQHETKSNPKAKPQEE